MQQLLSAASDDFT